MIKITNRVLKVVKKKLFLAGVVALMAAAAVTGYNAYGKSNVSELINANVEALAHDENDCNYRNGYRSFTGRNGGAYDCCKVWRSNKPVKDDHCS